MKRVRLFIVVLLVIPVLLLSWLTATENGLHWLYQRIEFYLPAELSLTKLEGKLIGPITVSGFEYQQDGTLITADQIIVDWQPGALLAANINISRAYIQSLTIVLPATEETEQTQTTEQTLTLPEVSLPWRLLLKHAEVDGLSISQDEQHVNLNKIKLSATTLFSQINIKELDINADTFSMNIKGKLQPTQHYRHDLKINWQTSLPSSAIINGHGQLVGDMQSTRVKQELKGPLQLTLDAELNNLLNQLTWLAKIDVTQFDVAKLDASWPALSGTLKLDAKGDLSTATLSGKLKGKSPETGALKADFNLQRLSNNSIQIDQLKMQAPDSDTQLDASGLWSPGKNGGEIKLSLDWKNLRWPIQDSPWFNSANGSSTIEGNVDRYQIELKTDSPWPQTSPSTWHAMAIGNLDGMEIQSLLINAVKGEANVNGQLNWSPQLSWAATGKVSNIDPASLWPQWPGNINGKLTSTGRMVNDQLDVDVDINQLKGKLRNYPVSLRSRLNWREDHLDITQLKFHSGNSLLELQGKIGETLKLNWLVNSSDLAELYPETSGKLQAKGSLSGPRETPLIEASFNGTTLSYPNIEIAAIKGKVTADLYHWQQIDIKLAAQTLKLNDTILQSLNINSDQQGIKAQATTKNLAAQVELKGEAHTTGWSGHIEQASIQSKQFDNWQLTEPAALNISANSLNTDTLCWHNNQQALLCASIEQKNSLWRSRINMSKAPLKLLEQWLPNELKLGGIANANAELEYQSPEQLLVQLDIELPPGVINYPMLSGDKDQREYRSGKMQLAINSQGLIASSEITMANGDLFSGQLELPGAKPLATKSTEQPLKASAQVNINDLRLMESLMPELHDLRGELKLQLTANGSLEQPTLSGHADLINGSLQIPRLGLTIDQLSFNSESDGAKKFNFRLDARSADGSLAISGHTRLDRSAGWPTEINIKGDQFEVSRIPEARVLASPDLQIKLKNRAIDIKGKIHIPYAKLQPKDITQAANVSSDAVIIGGEQLPEEKWLINTSVRLTLGERVSFYGFGFEGRLGGSLLLQDEPGQLTKATGEITIPEGTYRAYGQRLEVENGRLLYTGGPLSNPGLDMRAVRKVDSVTAGILLKGSLNQPQLEIFSSPAMGQTDALAYLLTGGPIENASNEEGTMMAKAALALGLSGGDSIARSLGDRFGFDDMRVESSDSGDQAALVVGRYLSPKLYASYGVGLIQDVNTLSLRYQISNKWQIKAESGGYQGADILYTFER